MSERAPIHNLRRLGVASLLCAVALSGCSKTSAEPKPTPRQQSATACQPLGIDLSPAMQQQIMATHTWPAALGEFPHVGEIVGVQVHVPAKYIHNKQLDPTENALARTVANAFLSKYNPDHQQAEVQIMSDAALVGKKADVVRLEEYDQLCSSVVAGYPAPTAPESA